MPSSRLLTRREFLGRAGGAVLGSTTILQTLLNLGLAGSASAQGGGGDYRALVCLFFAGGIDSFNVLAPRGAAEYAEYAGIRQDLALPQADLLPITPLNAVGRELGLHPGMPELQALFEQGRAAFAVNVGTLVERITKAQFENDSAPVPLGLFSHSDQIQQWQSALPDQAVSIGWAGRAADLLEALNENAQVAMNISLSGSNVWQAGNQAIPYSITQDGSIGLEGYEGTWNRSHIRGAAVDRQLALAYHNLFEKTLADNSRHAIDGHYRFMEAINGAPPLATVFPDTHVAGDLEMVARVIAARSALQVTRQTFFVMAGGWDHHDGLIDNQAAMLPEISQAVGAFYNALVELGVETQVTLFTASDFARTLTSNGRGSDHAWGGNHFVVGGAVNGRRVFGQYPVLYEGNPLDVWRGSLIPTTSTDEYFAELALWLGVSRSDLATVLPNIARFYNTGSPSMPMGFLPA